MKKLTIAVLMAGLIFFIMDASNKNKTIKQQQKKIETVVKKIKKTNI